MHSALNLIGVIVIAGWLAGCSDEQPSAPPTPQTSPPAATPAPSAPAAPEAPQAPPQSQSPPDGAGAPAGGQSQVAQGEQVYNSTCAACHAMGVAGAPKLGDKAAWAPRIAQGEQVMFQHAKAGFQGKTGFMPPKGGNPSLTDEQLRAAIDYMTAKSK